MPLILPTTSTPPTRSNPKVLLIYSAPKVGKTSAVAQLPETCLFDLEDGSGHVEAMRLQTLLMDMSPTSLAKWHIDHEAHSEFFRR
mgnify:CR=1 FL=1